MTKKYLWVLFNGTDANGNPVDRSSAFIINAETSLQTIKAICQCDGERFLSFSHNVGSTIDNYDVYEITQRNYEDFDPSNPDQHEAMKEAASRLIRKLN